MNAKSTTVVDIKTRAKQKLCGCFSFAKPDLLMSHLSVTPGFVTAFAIMNDIGGRVNVDFDKELLASDSLNCHPRENTATTNIAREDLLRFIRATGHEPKIITLMRT